MLSASLHKTFPSFLVQFPFNNISHIYTFSDGTGVGGTKIDPNTDYISTNGEIQFNHAETYKTITVEVNKSVKVCFTHRYPPL